MFKGYDFKDAGAKDYKYWNGVEDMYTSETLPAESPASKIAVIMSNMVQKYYTENPDTGVLKTGTNETED